jgi:3-dehydroquinate synthase
MNINIAFQEKTAKDYTVFINNLKNLTFDNKLAIITNPTISGLHLKTLLNYIEAEELYIITIPDGEEYKNQETIELIMENLFNHRFNRNCTLIAFGGGVIGDMTGYVASIYQRGLDFIQIPTTLLSQVDSSVGGKTGINNRYGKNLIGAFYQPKSVYIETDFLKTLPSREFSAGVAEILKMSITFDKDFFHWLESADLHDENSLSEAIQKAVALKAKVVAEDEKEKGLRAVLNYGHTFAHVIENQTNYSKYVHGEAVAIGINMANALAFELGLLSSAELEKIQNILQKYNLPIKYDIKDVELFYEGFYLDKKTMNSKIKFILPNSIGSFVMRDDIDKDIVLKVLKEFN